MPRLMTEIKGLMFIDSHCHIDGEQFDADRDEVVQRAMDAGVVAMLNVGTGDPHSDDFRRAVAVAEKYDNVFASVGVHPHDAKLYDDKAENHLIDLVKSSEKVIACPHAMCVQDAALMMNVLKRPDARDWTSLPYDPSDYTVGLHDGLRGLRIAWSPTLGYASNVQPDVAQATLQAVQLLQALGAHVEQVDPGIEDPLDISTGLWFFGAYSLFKQLTPAQQALVDPDFRAQAMLGEKLGALDVQQLNLRRGALGSHMRQFMTRFDLLATPSLAVTAFDAKPAGHSPMDAKAMLGWTPFSYPFNLTQQPACSIPCGLDRQGLPIGLQLVGPMFGDALVLRAARAYESARAIPRPDLSRL